MRANEDVNKHKKSVQCGDLNMTIRTKPNADTECKCVQPLNEVAVSRPRFNQRWLNEVAVNIKFNTAVRALLVPPD